MANGNAMVSGIFVGGKEADIALFLQVTRIRKIRKNLRGKLVDYDYDYDYFDYDYDYDYSETGRLQATNLETQKQTKRIEIHQSQITEDNNLLKSFK